MHYKIPENRNQMMLFPQIEMWVAKDNPVRLIDLVVEKLVKENPEKFTWKGKNNTGCTSYSPATMSKLLLYSYFNWIAGSRRMEKETYRNIELIWLLGNLHPDHWTICEFRRENKESFRFIATSFRRFLKDSGYISGGTIAVDGSKVKAYASPEMYTLDGVAKRLENIESQIGRYIDNWEELDNLENQLENSEEEKKKLHEKIAKLERGKKKLERINQQLKKSGKKRISPNDPDASLMKGRDGKKACYNVQTGVDSKNKMFVFAEATTEENDLRMLRPAHEAITGQLGHEPEALEADTGYYNTGQIKEIEEHSSTICFVPIRESPAKQKDKENNIHFEYDKEKDEFTCPQSKQLKLKARNIKHSGQSYNQYRCYECQGCPVREKCTTSKKGRTIKRNVDQDWIDHYKHRVSGRGAKDKISERKTLVEHPFGTMKLMMGKHCFLLTQKHKVQIELELYSTAYNLKRLINIENMDTLLQKLENYDWKIAA
jgi:transposase